MIKRIILPAALCLLAATFLSAQVQYRLDQTPQKVLFVGNSYTYTNLSLHISVPAMAALAASPDSFIAEASLIGGASLKRHWNDGFAAAKIRTGGYDVVILQEFVNMDPALAYLDSFFHYAVLFDDLIDSVGAQTVFYQTWNTPYMNFTYTKAAYDSAAVLYDAPVVPAGEGYELVNADRPSLNLYGPDHHHPGWPGTYLTTCIFYAALTGKSPVGIDYTVSSTVTGEEYAYLQGAAWDVMRGFIESPCGDASAPAVPSGMAAVPVSTSSVRITWNAVPHTCGQVKYRVFRDGLFAGAAYQPLFTDVNLLGGKEYAYTVSAVSATGTESAQSSAATASTLEDTVAPVLLEAGYTRLPTRVILSFNEPLDTASAETPGNYAVSGGINVTAAALSGAAEVTLTTTTMSADVVYTITVTGVRDNATGKNLIGSGAEKSFSYIPLSFMADCVGYWPFDGTLDDFSPTGANGSWSNDPAYATGYLKDGITLTGDTAASYVSIPGNTAQDGMAALSFAVWAKKAHADTGGYIILKHSTYTLELTDNDVYGYVGTADGTGRFNTATALVSDSEWHHYAVSYDGSALTLYIDAVPVNTVAHTGTVSSTNRTIMVGKYPWGAKQSFNGKIDELRIYDTALDSAGVAALFNDEPYAAGDADSAAVRILLDRNAVASTVDMVTTRDPASGRVLALHLDSLSVDQITDHIGTLTAMRALYCTGAPATDTALISVDFAIGNCTALETLILAHNTLTTLPDGIVNLTGLTLLDVGSNMLCDVSEPVKSWLNTYDPDWEDSQSGCSGIVLMAPATHLADGVFSIAQADGRVTFTHRGDGEAGVRIIKTDGTPVFGITRMAVNAATWRAGTAGIYVVELSADGKTETVKLLVR